MGRSVDGSVGGEQFVVDLDRRPGQAQRDTQALENSGEPGLLQPGADLGHRPYRVVARSVEEPVQAVLQEAAYGVERQRDHQRREDGRPEGHPGTQRPIGPRHHERVRRHHETGHQQVEEGPRDDETDVKQLVAQNRHRDGRGDQCDDVDPEEALEAEQVVDHEGRHHHHRAEEEPKQLSSHLVASTPVARHQGQQSAAEDRERDDLAGHRHPCGLADGRPVQQPVDTEGDCQRQVGQGGERAEEDGIENRQAHERPPSPAGQGPVREEQQGHRQEERDRYRPAQVRQIRHEPPAE